MRNHFYQIDHEYSVHSTLGKVMERDAEWHNYVQPQNITDFNAACEIAKHKKLMHEQEVKAEFDLGWIGGGK
jgi:hypothetical protein